MRIVSLLPSTTEILFALGAGRRGRRRDVRVRQPGRGAHPHHRLDVGDAGGHAPRRSTRTSPTRSPRRRPLPPRRRRPARPRRRPRGHPGPVRRLRGRRLHGRRRARPPRLHGRGAHRRPAHPRRGARLGRCTLGRATGHEPTAAADAGRRRCARGWTPSPARGRRPAAAARRRPRVDRPAVRPRPLDPRDGRARRRRRTSSARRARSRCGSPGTTSRPPAPTSSSCAPCGYDRAGAQAAGRRARRVDVLPPACRCTPSTPTRRGPGPGRGWSTGSRSSPRSLHPA